MIKGISFVGVRTEALEPMKVFCATVLGAKLVHEKPGFLAFAAPNGDRLEFFGPAEQNHQHFTTGPVCGFEVDDIVAARVALEAAGVELLSDVMGEPGRTQWVHFRAPDGNVYEIVKHVLRPSN